MHTLGYRFRPWTQDKAITDGPSILRYVRDAATEAGIDQHIRYRHRVERAAWSTEDARWTVDAVRRWRAGPADGELPVRLQRLLPLRRRLHPGLPRHGAIQGTVIHPQQWPDDLDYAGKKIVVIGSGATAVTLVPALAAQAEHVTMLQRSPTYIAARPALDKIGAKLTRRLGTRGGYAVTRWKNVALGTYFYQLCRRRPDAVKSLLRKAAIDAAAARLRRRHPLHPALQPVGPAHVPGARTATSSPRSGAAGPTWSPTRSPSSPRPGSGSSRGPSSRPTSSSPRPGCGCWRWAACGSPSTGATSRWPETIVYKGTMLSGVPNFTFTFGYTNSSWTLKADLVSQYAVRLLRYLDAHGYDQCVPVNDDPAVGDMADARLPVRLRAARDR